jgi:hypothetical protein
MNRSFPNTAGLPALTRGACASVAVHKIALTVSATVISLITILRGSG